MFMNMKFIRYLLVINRKQFKNYSIMAHGQLPYYTLSIKHASDGSTRNTTTVLNRGMSATPYRYYNIRKILYNCNNKCPMVDRTYYKYHIVLVAQLGGGLADYYDISPQKYPLLILNNTSLCLQNRSNHLTPKTHIDY